MTWRMFSDGAPKYETEAGRLWAFRRDASARPALGNPVRLAIISMRSMGGDRDTQLHRRTGSSERG